MKRQRRKVGVAGSFQNQIMGNNATEPKVGEGATILHYSDRSAFEVVEVSDNGNTCVIRPMDCKFIGCGYGDERYEYNSNPDAYTVTLKWHKGKWCKVQKTIEPIKADFRRWLKENEWDWYKGLEAQHGLTIEDITYDENDPEYNHYSAFYQYKLVDGVTKEYTNYSPVSIIFGVMEKYRDPSF